VLSQNMPTCWCFKSGSVDSRISHPNTIPASSRSFIVRSPVGFDGVRMRCLTSSGHSICHMMWFSALRPGDHIPPVPR
jgi:hypothetical protein